MLKFQIGIQACFTAVTYWSRFSSLKYKWKECHIDIILSKKGEIILICLLPALWKLIRIEKTFEPSHDKTNTMTYAPSEGSDQPGHPPSLVRVFGVRSLVSWGPNVSSCRQRRLIRLGGSESSLGAFLSKRANWRLIKLWMRRIISLRRARVIVWNCFDLAQVFFFCYTDDLMAKSTLLHLYRAVPLESLRENVKSIK